MPWVKAIVTHLHFTIPETAVGSARRQAMSLSVLGHIQDVICRLTPVFSSRLHGELNVDIDEDPELVRSYSDKGKPSSFSI